KANAEHLLKESERKDEFLAMLAHELRNPLAPIRHATLLLRRGAENVPPDKLFDLIDRQTTRLTRLVDDLLDVARISSGHIQLKREVIDLATVARQVSEACRPRIEEYRHRLSISVPDAPVYVNGDPVRLEQIVTNLLENAIKYTEPGGRLELTVRRDNRQALLCMRDSGIGLAPESQEAIFGLFTQIDSSLARSGGGLGIGLTLVRRVLALHGGTIEARSAGLGHGTEFIVRLPTEDLEGQAVQRAGQSPTRAPAQAQPGLRVLIVDDNPDAGESLALLARSWGHEVAVARDGPSALALAERFQPERALVDIGLPGMNGYELGRRLRDAHRRLYLIAMTGYGRQTDREAAHAAGFDLHLVKPANLEELEKLLADGGPKSGDRAGTT
ncbi:MAG TPA: ATP-binding protein, partial [Steroidobacteraceae bacterium]|nr:ATP-binding protein [Steroidobacteraceae bacterium]